MKQKFFLRCIIIFSLILILIKCRKEDQVYPSQSPYYPPKIVEKIKHPPIANAGLDTTFYLPFNACNLDASASSDSDNNIISYKWKLNHGPAPVSITTTSKGVRAYTSGMNKIGIYEFEVTVTDADNLSSSDTINITVANPNCVNPNSEIILKKLSWDFSWVMEINIYNFFSILPKGSFFKNIYIKRESGTTWELITPLDLNSPNYGKVHEWEFGNNTMVIYPPYSNMINDKPDIKLVYCN